MTMLSQPINNSRGLVLSSTLIISALIVFLSVAILNLIVGQQRENRSIHEQMQAFSVKYQILQTFTNPKSCTCQFQSLPIAGKNKIDITEIRDGCAGPHSLSQNANVGWNLSIDSIEIINISPSGVNTYKGQLKVAYKGEGLVRAIQPIKVNMQFHTDPSSATPDAISHCVGRHKHTAQLDFIDGNVGKKIEDHDNRTLDNRELMTNSVKPKLISVGESINNGLKSEKLPPVDWSCFDINEMRPVEEDGGECFGLSDGESIAHGEDSATCLDGVPHVLTATGHHHCTLEEI